MAYLASRIGMFLSISDVGEHGMYKSMSLLEALIVLQKD